MSAMLCETNRFYEIFHFFTRNRYTFPDALKDIKLLLDIHQFAKKKHFLEFFYTPEPFTEAKKKGTRLKGPIKMFSEETRANISVVAMSRLFASREETGRRLMRIFEPSTRCRATGQRRRERPAISRRRFV